MLLLASCAAFRRDVSTVRVSVSASEGKATLGTSLEFEIRDPSKDGSRR